MIETCPVLYINSECFGQHHYLMTSSNGNISALLAICAGNSPVPGEFPAQRPVTRSFDVFSDLRLNGRLSKQSWAYDLKRHHVHHDVTVMICTNIYRQSGDQDWIPKNVTGTGKCEHGMMHKPLSSHMSYLFLIFCGDRFHTICVMWSI